jgi:hypothetical protein
MIDKFEMIELIERRKEGIAESEMRLLNVVEVFMHYNIINRRHSSSEF